MKTKIVVQTLIILIAMIGTAIADDRSPVSQSNLSNTATYSHDTVPQTNGMIKAVVLKSWAYCSSGSVVWDDLNANWASYGSTPIYINYATHGLCDGIITYDNLIASGADVVIISDPLGGGQQYSIDEINAIRKYATEGHNVLGTYLLFQWGSTENLGLADIFGLRYDLSYKTLEEPFVNMYNVLEPINPLFKNIAGTYDSQGYPYTQIPIDLSWDVGDLNGARYVARGTDNKAIITIYDAPKYSALYISNMPEYLGGNEDKQFLYNAIVYTLIPSVSIFTDKSNYKQGDKMLVGLNLTNPGDITTVQASVWVDTPGEGKHMVMDKPSLSLPAGFKYSTRVPITLPKMPSGNYAWHAVLKNSKSEIISESIAPWTFTGTTVKVESFETVLDNVVMDIE